MRPSLGCPVHIVDECKTAGASIDGIATGASFEARFARTSG